MSLTVSRRLVVSRVSNRRLLAGISAPVSLFSRVRGLARVGIAHDGHHRDLVLAPLLTLGTPNPAHVLQVRPEFVDLAVDVPPVRFQLGLAGALGPDRALAAGTRLALQVGPHTRQTGQQILILRQLHLEPAFPGPGPLGKNVQNQAAPVQHLDAQGLRQHPHLRGREIIVKNHHGGAAALAVRPDLLYLALANKTAGVRRGTVLQHRPHRLGSGGLHQSRQLLHGLLIRVFFLLEHRRA